MKLSISTLGCPNWTFEQILTNFSALGVEGIEVRGIEGIADADKIPFFFPENAADTLSRIADHGLRLIGFGTSASFHDAAKLLENIAQCTTAIDVCERLGIPAIRVFGNNCPAGEGHDETLARIGGGVRDVCRYAADHGVRVNLEVHGDVNTVENIKPVLDIAGGESAFGIIWDVAHSDRGCGADFVPFYETIRPFIRHIHLKDHTHEADGTFKLCHIGEGDIPLKPIIRRLLDDGYDGYFSFEWEKRWVPTLDEPEIAFPKFVNFMKEFM